VPLLGEFLTWYVQFLAHKPVPDASAGPADCAGDRGGVSGRPWEE